MSGGLYSMEEKDFDRTLDLAKVKPYGDTMNDGKIQLSFTLPVPIGAEAEEAAGRVVCEHRNRRFGAHDGGLLRRYHRHDR